jgi:hypothetical protein
MDPSFGYLEHSDRQQGFWQRSNFSGFTLGFTHGPHQTK